MAKLHHACTDVHGITWSLGDTPQQSVKQTKSEPIDQQSGKNSPMYHCMYSVCIAVCATLFKLYYQCMCIIIVIDEPAFFSLIKCCIATFFCTAEFIMCDNKTLFNKMIAQ